MKILWLLFSALAIVVCAPGCGRTGTICVTATDCPRGQACTANGCVDVSRDGGIGGGGTGGGFGGGSGGGFGGGSGGGFGGGGSPNCMPGFADCDFNSLNGCEADLRNPATCGSCSNVCPVGVSCTNGSCAGACAAAAAGTLNLNTTVMGTLASGTARFALPTCSIQSTRFEDLWTLVITAPSSVTLETGGSLDTVLMLRSNCTATTDLACNDDTPGLGTNSRIITTLQPGSYSVFVKQWGMNAMGGAYSLSASATSTNNSTCNAATPLVVGGMPVTLEAIDSGGAPLTACLPGQGGRVRYYSVVVPARSAVNVGATPNVFDLGLRVFSSCATTNNACAAFSDGQPSGPESIRITNASASTQTFIVAASSSVAGSGGTFSIAANAATPPPATNAFCNTPTALVPNSSISNEFINVGGLPLHNVCLPSQSGYARYYSVAVPPGNTLQAVVQPNLATGLDVGARVLQSCAASSCLASNDSRSDPFVEEAVVVSNSTTFTQNVLLAVTASNVNALPGNSFSLQANVVPTATNGACAGATAMMVGQTLMGETLGGGGAPRAACLNAPTGLTKYYGVTLAVGEQVEVSVLPANFDANLRVFDTCGASSCVGVADKSPTFAPERVTVRNGTGALKQFVIAVSAPAATTTAGIFALSILRTPYVISRITASCDDLSMVPDLLGPATMPVLDDDVGTGALTLPAGFVFPYFSTPVTHFSACMNGFAQLLPSLASAVDCSFSNLAMPDGSSPNGLIAPFWDDLLPVPTTRLRTVVNGTAPNRVFTLEWFDATFINAGPERLHFQTKLFETSGTIEFHYCSLVANGGMPEFVTGRTATIGLENLAGTEAAQHSSDAANSVAGGGGLRFVRQ